MVLFGRVFCDFCRDSVHKEKEEEEEKTAQFGKRRKRKRRRTDLGQKLSHCRKDLGDRLRVSKWYPLLARHFRDLEGLA